MWSNALRRAAAAVDNQRVAHEVRRRSVRSKVALAGVAALALGGLAAPAVARGGASSAAAAVRDIGPARVHIVAGHLALGSARLRSVGLNAYELATYWGRNAGCGPMLDDTHLDAFFASLPAHTLVRTWAWQGSMATSFQSKRLDWRPLDRVMAAAAAHHVALIVSLAGQSGTCDDGHWKGPDWYAGGYRRAYDDDHRGLAPLPYAQYVRAVVTRYAHSPAVAMWELVNEPESSSCANGHSGDGCYGHLTCANEWAAERAMRRFFDVVGGEVHSLDRDHLVESGFIGSGQCGTSGDDYTFVGASPGIDVLSYHDYYPAASTIGGDQWNGIAVRLRQARLLRKPIIGGELGVAAGGGAGCISLAARRADVARKAHAQLAAGADAVLLWNWQPAPTSPCDDSTFPGDPALGLVGHAR